MSTTTASPERENDRSIAALTMLGHGLFHYFEMAIPILLVVWIDSFPTGVEVAGLIVAIGFAPIGIAALPGGMLSDRYGPGVVLLGSIAGMSLGFGALALAPSIYGVGLALAVWGLFAGVYHPAGMSLISTGAASRGTIFAYHGMAGNLGTALGPFVAATLLLVFEWRVVAGLLALPGVAAFMYGLSIDFDPTAAVDEPAEAAADERDETPLIMRGRELLHSLFPIVLAIVVFDGLFYRGVTAYLPRILRELSAMPALTITDALVGVNVGDYIFVGLLVVGIAGQWVGGTLSDRIAVETGLTGGFALLGLFSLLFVPVAGVGFAPLLLVSALLGFFLFFVQPMYQVAVAVHTPAATRGLSYGVTYLGEFGIGALGIALGGVLLGSYSTRSFFVVIAGFAFLATFLAVLLGVKSRRS
ncbi:MFS transporter [Halodesulfurarchaeum formicicum]|uniref:Major facilitator superfamily MFS_1 n=1 Tax=Halodesulfurarchaeum formicicum TaxID=1873524 RepID=A0A1J1AB53_9EURY|nr:MFS transporter [Halodesulfurarchaeum formicicum]APE94967.1 major facilitator superfamily MFS_1 [Halodesulfurarchaeum formicicum]